MSLAHIDHLLLIDPNLALAVNFVAMVEEFVAAGEPNYHSHLAMIRHRVHGYVRLLARRAHRRRQHPALSTFWLVDPAGQVLGASTVYHDTDALIEQHYGHIGFHVRPSLRGQGLGACLLALTLPRARALGHEQVLLTCHADNRASSRIIQANGGELLDRLISPVSGEPLEKFRIALQPFPNAERPAAMRPPGTDIN